MDREDLDENAGRALKLVNADDAPQRDINRTADGDTFILLVTLCQKYSEGYVAVGQVSTRANAAMKMLKEVLL